MIPYLTVPPLHIWGPFSLQPFGLLVATGCVVGFFVARWHAKSLNLDTNALRPLLFCILIPGFVLAHLTSLVLYYPEALRGGPLLGVPIGAVISSYGGFLGGAIGALAYLKWRDLPVWEFADSLVLGLCAGWFFGRLGCAIAHDHPGVRSNFILAVKYPLGPRHDLGLYEWLYTILLIGTLLALRSRRPTPGLLLGAVCILYAPVRFLLDFLRVGDRLYYGLTPAQYGSAALLLLGIWILTVRRELPRRR